MATPLANTLALLDALADFRGASLTQQRKAAIVEEYLDVVGQELPPADLAEQFLDRLCVHIREKGRFHRRKARKLELEAELDAAEAAAESNI